MLIKVKTLTGKEVSRNYRVASQYLPINVLRSRFVLVADRNRYRTHRQGGENQRKSRGKGGHSASATKIDFFR